MTELFVAITAASLCILLDVLAVLLLPEDWEAEVAKRDQPDR